MKVNLKKERVLPFSFPMQEYKKVNTDKNIVLIDDNLVDLVIHEKVIKKFKVNSIRKFSDAQTALSFFKLNKAKWESNKKEQPDIVFIDINMPNMNGFDLLKSLKDFNVFKQGEIKIFLLSSSNNIADVNMSKQCSLCSGYIIKPLTYNKMNLILNVANPNKYIIKI